MKKISSLISIISTALLLSACGGGGSSGNHSPSSPATTEKMKPTDNTEMQQKDLSLAQSQTMNNSSVEQPKVGGDQVIEPPKVDMNPPIEQPKAGNDQMVESPKVETNPPIEQPKAGSDQMIESPKVETNPPIEQPKAGNDQMVESPTVETNPPIEQPKAGNDQMVEPKKDIWSGDFAHSKNAVPVFYLIDSKNSSSNDDPNVAEKQKGVIELQLGRNADPQNNYRFLLLNDNAYYGFYRDSEDKLKVNSHLVYSYNAAAENKGSLSQLTANYRGEFLYQTRGLPNVNTPSKVELNYENGVAKGVINSHQGDKMFDVRSTENPRELELISTGWLVNSLEDIQEGNKGLLNIHFINATDGTENKVLVGKGGNGLYWGVIGAEKQ